MSYEPIFNIKLVRTPIQRLLDILVLIALCFFWVTVINVYPTLPDFIPTHFSLDGTPDSFGSRKMIFLLPAISTILVLIMTLLSFRPQLFNYAVPIGKQNAAKQYRTAVTYLLLTQLLVVILFILIDIHTISIAFERESPINKYCIPSLVLALFIPSILHFFKSKRMR